MKLNLKQIAMVTRDNRYTQGFFGLFLKFKYVVKVSYDYLNRINLVLVKGTYHP